MSEEQSEMSMSGLGALEAALDSLNKGEILAPVDDRTGNYEKWLNEPPQHHDLKVITYTKYDTNGWVGRVKKYKMEICHQATRVRRLEDQVRQLKRALEDQTLVIENNHRLIDDTFAQIQEHQDALDEVVDKHQTFEEENVTLRRHLLAGRRAAEKITQESNHIYKRVRALEAEHENSARRYENCLGEKEKLRLEREWFFRERILLEETINREARDAIWDDLRLRLSKLRHSMHRTWAESKIDDVRGQLRAAKSTPNQEEWFHNRRRMYNVRPVEGSSGSVKTE